MIDETQKSSIIENILTLAVASTKQLNKNAVFRGPMADDWYLLSILNSAHVVELAIKAVVAKTHPLLIFKRLPSVSSDGALLSLDDLIEKGQSVDFQDLPQLLWAVTGERISNQALFNEGRKARNIVQHFLSPSNDLSTLALKFTYEIADPLLVKYFNLYPVEFHSNPDDCRYLVETLIREEIKFSIPSGFGFEYLEAELSSCSDNYRQWFRTQTAG